MTADSVVAASVSPAAMAKTAVATTESAIVTAKLAFEMQNGIENFILGTETLKDRNYSIAQKQLKDAEKVFTSGDFAQILSDGITKSKIQDWHKSQSEIDSEIKKLKKLSKEELIEMIIKLTD